MSLTERDQKILDILKRFGWVREDFLAKYLGLDYSLKNVKILMSKLTARLDGFIYKEKYLYSKPFYWTLGKLGCEVMGVIKSKKMVLGNLAHDDIVAELGVSLLTERPDCDLLVEHEIRQTLYGKDAKEKKIPDLILDLKTAIEVEITKKDDRRIATIINNYELSNYETILYYTNSISIINIIHRYTHNSSKFKFKLFDTSILDSQDYTVGKLVDINRNEQTGVFEPTNNLMKKLIESGKRNG